MAQDPTFATYPTTLLRDEVQPMLSPPADLQLDEYARIVLARFANSTIGDTCVRICQGGNGKFPKFILPTVVVQIQRKDGQPPKIRMRPDWPWLPGSASTPESTSRVRATPWRM